jgi:hypothetical protein
MKNNEQEISGNDDIVQRKKLMMVVIDDGDDSGANLYECCEGVVMVATTGVTTLVLPCLRITSMGASMAKIHPFRGWGVSVHGVEQIYTTRCWNPAW